MKICLGVVDMPYDYGEEPATTFEVATRLEEDYGLFSHFWAKHRDDIIQEAGTAVAHQLINRIRYGAPDGGELQMGEVIQKFNIFLEQEEMAGLGVAGVPTQAAIHGVNSRLKRQFGPRRPSFIDGGLFKTSFTAWIENDAET